MKRCTKCILPENYPGIRFNDAGVCNFCLSYEPRHYLGGDALREKIVSFKPLEATKASTYDCVVGLSGGRDSSYLLYYVSKMLNLNVVAYCVDNGLMPDQTMKNIERMAKILNVKLVIEKHNHLNDCLRHHMKALMHNPSAPMVGMLCTGCRLDVDTGLVNYARQHGIPVIVSGSTPLEGGTYKRDLMKLQIVENPKLSFFAGYLFQILKNPLWVMNLHCTITQIREYLVHFRKKHNQSNILTIGPFFNYIHWVETEVINTIENELDWKKHSSMKSTWRGDCDVALLKLYLYKKILGFNDKDDGLSCLIRDGQITREEALVRLESEGDIPNEVISEILGKFGWKLSALEKILP